MNIGQAAASSGVSAKMVRHYETIGLLPRAARSGANYRVYSPSEVHVLRFIKRARTLGFSIADIKELVGLWQDKSRSNAAVRKIAGRHIDELKRKIQELNSVAETLENLVRHCRGDHRPDCPILDDLAKHHGDET